MKKGIGLLLVLAFFCAAMSGSLAEAPETHASGNFEYILRQDGSACLTRYTGTSKALSIPGEMDGYTVKAIGVDAFPKGLAVSSILIPGSIREISEGAFRYLDKLVAIGVMTVNPVYTSEQGVLFDKSKKLLHTYPKGRGGALYGIPRGIEAIAENAFYQCQYLQGVFVPSSVMTIGEGAFYGSKKVTRLLLSDGIKTIEGKAFAGLNQLISLKIPKSVSYIGPGVLLRCESLEDLLVDGDNPVYTAINGALVEKETKLLHTYLHKKAGTVVRIPGGIKAIGDLAFSDCFVMKEVTVPESVENIGAEAFARCYNLSSAILPGSAMFIGPGAFLDCARLNMKVTEGSNAHQYALENGIPFELGGR
jgi:hypothetical protein